MAFSNKKTVVGISLVLAAVNALWLGSSVHRGPLVGLVCYSLCAFLCGRRDDFRAGLIIGIAGFTIHVVELVLEGVAGLRVSEVGFLFANLLLPIPLIYFSLKARRQRAPSR